MSEKTSKLLEQFKKAMQAIDLKEEYKESALLNVKDWLTEEQFKAYVPQIEFMVQEGYINELIDAFYKVISFGTGGRRGKVGVAPNRINKWTIQSSAQGHSQYF